MKDFVQTAVYDDYDLLVQLCDSLALPTGFCLLEKRFVDVTIRLGASPIHIPRWQKVSPFKNTLKQKPGAPSMTYSPVS